MFDSDRWSEIWNTLSRNKLRSFLTMFGVFWGIFMLVVMLGMGNGLSRGVLGSFDGWATNSCFIWTMRTSIPFDGFKRGRSFNFENSDIEAIKTQVDGVDIVAPRLQLGGWRDANNVSYGNKTGAFNVYGDVPEIIGIQATQILQGRFLNHRDLAQATKVCVIGTKTESMLFDNVPALGKHIKINGVYFRVVGVHKPKASAEMGEDKSGDIYLPFSTFQKAFNSVNMVHWFSVTGKPGVEVSRIEKDVKLLMAKRHRVHPDDPLAFGSWNMQEMFNMMNMLFLGISIISWIVGICTLLAGVIGIGNIMLVIVRERTNEIGIRRSLGATPANITSQIIMEAISLTFIAGYFGLVFGIALLEGITAMNIESDFFSSPEVDLNVALVALTILLVSGLLAGLFPALRALRINAVDALRAE
ncbi:MAG: ABC transporter permease [Flavobacteriales bacterium]|nr:ABC transporter permease [Flavobacteriales bacterium]